MFGSLKKRLKEAVEKVSKTISKEEPQPKEMPKKEEFSAEVKKEPPIKEQVTEEQTTEESKDEAQEEPLFGPEPEEPYKEKEEEIDLDVEIDKEIEELEEIKEETAGERLSPQIAESEIEVKEAEKEEKTSHGFSFFRRVSEKKLSDTDIEKILKELHMALLENDVAVEVADRISTDVKKELFGASVKRGKVENTIKDALRNAMLDVMKQDKIDLDALIKKKDGPFTIMMVGFNGTGKCVSGDTLVPLTNGGLVSIEELYEKAKLNNNELPVDDGYIINKPSLSVFSVNPYTLKIEKIHAQNIWKLKKDKLLRVTLENGQEIKVTPEHPFFVLKPGNIIQKCADSVSPKDYLMVPKIVRIENKPHIRLELLNKMSSRKLFVKSEIIVEEAYCLMKRAFGSLEKAFQEILPESDWMTFRYFWKSNSILPSTVILKLAEKDNEFAKKVENEEFCIKFGRSKLIKFPEVNEDFYQWLGLFYAEGYMGPNYIEFTNSEDWLLERFSSLTKSIFGVNKVCIKPDIRHPNVKKSLAANTSLVYFVEKALEIPKYKKSSYMKLPEWVLRGSNDLIASFLRAYWEGDGSAGLKHRVLEASTASEKFAIQHSLLLLRFGIIASLGKKNINGKYYYRNSIVGKGKLKTFQNSIGFLGDEKQKKLENLIAMNSQFERTELIPMQSEYLKNLRLSSGILQQDMANLLNIGPSLLSQYELGYYQVSIPIERIAELSVRLSSPFLETLAGADVRWVKVRKVEEVIGGEEWVYDFTIPGYHNFVANNFIIHNTTTLAKLANKLKKYKPVLAAADTFRAASIEQLEEHGRRLDMRVVKHTYGSDAAAVIFDAKKHAEATGSKLVLADTAGRSHSNVNLMDELKKVARVNNPDMKILVLDSITGNDIYDQCRLFNDAVGVDAIILTKADVYERGGSALSAAFTLKKPILYMGVGQEYDDLQEFDPEEIVNNLIG